MKRIGLTQRVELAADYNERRDCLDQRWSVFMTHLGYLPIPLVNAINDIEIYLSAYPASYWAWMASVGSTNQWGVA